MDITLLIQLIGPPSGAIVAASGALIAVCRTVMAWLRDRQRREWLAATPEQQAKLGPIPSPYPPSGPGPAAAVLFGAVLSIGLPFAQGYAHPLETMARLGILQAEQPAAQRPPDCTGCKPPSRCTANGCEGNALPHPKGIPFAKPLSADNPGTKRLDSAVALEPGEVGLPSALSRLPGWAQ